MSDLLTVANNESASVQEIWMNEWMSKQWTTTHTPILDKILKSRWEGSWRPNSGQPKPDCNRGYYSSKTSEQRQRPHSLAKVPVAKVKFVCRCPQKANTDHPLHGAYQPPPRHLTAVRLTKGCSTPLCFAIKAEIHVPPRITFPTNYRK